MARRRVCLAGTVLLALAVGMLVYGLPPLNGAGRVALAWLLGRYLHQPVHIAALQLDWYDGQPRLSLDGLRVGSEAAPLLRRGQVRAQLDLPQTVLAWRPVWRTLQVHGDTLVVRRQWPTATAQPFNPDRWLRRLFSVERLDLTFDRLELQRPGALLVLGRRLQLRLEPGAGQHRLSGSLTGADGSQRLQVSAILHGTFEQQASWRATFQLHARALQPALWPLPMASQPGSGRLDIDLAGHWRSTGTSELHAQGRLQAPLPPAGAAYDALRSWLGRLPDWRYSLQGQRHHNRWHWQLRLAGSDHQGVVQNSSVISVDSANGHWRGRLVRLQAEQLAALVAPWLAPAARAVVNGLAPSGGLPVVDFDYAPARQTLRLQGRFTGLSSRTWHDVPGLTGLSGRFSWDGQAGELQLDDQAATVHWPMLRGPARLDHLAGMLRWRQTAAGWRIMPLLTLANTDLGGRLNGIVWLTPGSSPELALQVDFAATDVARIPAYLPVRLLRPKLVDWFDRALLAGRLLNGHMTLYGRAADFPFAHGRGRFEVHCQVAHMRLAYASGWPPLDDLRATLRVHGSSLAISAAAGRLLGIPLEPVTAAIPDLGDATLTLTGGVQGPAASMLQFVQQSPLRTGLGAYLQGLRLQGDATLRLALSVPIGHGERPLAVNGHVNFAGNDLTLVRQDLQFRDLRGGLDFTRTSLRADNLQVRLNGDPLTVGLRNTPTLALQLHASSLLSPTTLTDHYARWLTPYVSGHSGWTVRFELPRAADSGFRLQLTSDLRGSRITLPGSLGKNATDARPLRLDWQQQPDRTTALALHYGDGVTAQATLTPQHALRSATARLSGLLLAGQNWGALTVQAQRAAQAYSIRLSGPYLAGQLRWPVAPGPAQPLQLHLQRLNLAAVDGANGEQTLAVQADPQQLPPLELSIDALSLAGHRLGQLALTAAPVAQGYALRALELSGPAYNLHAEGLWRQDASGVSSQLQVGAHSSALGQTLAALAVPVQLARAAADAELQLRWAGDPLALRLKTLTGRLRVAVGAGRLTQLKPGLERFWGLVSLDSLSRRLQLDFSDLAKTGLAFDSITGQATLGHGQAQLDPLVLLGPALDLHLQGRVGLARQDLDLLMTLTPQLGMPLAIAGTLAGGPVLGATMLLANKVLKPGFGRLLNLRYTITGRWQAPQVTLLQAPRASSPAAGNRK